MAKFVTIGERLSTTAPAVNKAFTERDPEPIIKRAKQQLDAGLHCAAFHVVCTIRRDGWDWPEV